MAGPEFSDLRYKDLVKKNILLTGASGAIGSEVARILLRAGATLHVIGRNHSKLQMLESTPGSTGSLFSYICDLQRPTDIKQTFTAILERVSGRLDGIINCAGQSLIKNFEDTSLKDFDDIMTINVRAAMHLMSMAVPFMKLTGGAIVNVSATAVPRSRQSVFCVSKACMDSLTQCSALELANFGIRVNGVAPGIVVSDFRINQAENPISREANDAGIQEANGKGMIGGTCSPNDVAEVVVWLVSDESSYVTGEIINVDGGSSIDSAISRIGWKGEERREESQSIFPISKDSIFGKFLNLGK
jgi:NAD(P)-dependent dehydrogenase (short-subunit alcohol dehydrogenase family)